MSVTPFTLVVGSSKLKDEAVFNMPSRASTPASGSKPRSSALKRSLQDAFAEGVAKDNQLVEHIGLQKHERALRELDLKRRKLENKAKEQQHQRDREREQHEFRMMQMRMMIAQNQQAVPGGMQAQNQLLLGGGLTGGLTGSLTGGLTGGLLGELDDPSLASDSPPISSFSM
jgi:hypothetical protein